MKHHDRYFIAAALLLASFLSSMLADLGVFNSVAESGLLDWISWILGTAGVLFFGLAISEHKKRH